LKIQFLTGNKLIPFMWNQFIQAIQHICLLFFWKIVWVFHVLSIWTF